MTAWRIRPGLPGDRALLGAFSCAKPGITWQVEVEEFIARDLCDWAFAPGAADDDPRLLLTFESDSGDLIGLAAHERAALRGPDGDFYATRLQVVAVAAPWQGRRFPTGERASDVVMSAAMVDISARVPPRYARVFAVVHEENAASIALCRRHGFIEEMSPAQDPSYRRLITAHRD